MRRILIIGLALACAWASFGRAQGPMTVDGSSGESVGSSDGPVSRDMPEDLTQGAPRGAPDTSVPPDTLSASQPSSENQSFAPEGELMELALLDGDPVALCWRAYETPVEIANCLGDAWETADRELGRLETQTLNQAMAIETLTGINAAQERLKKANRAWRAYMDANCALWAAFAPRDTGASRAETACAIRMTQTRTAELGALAEGRDPALQAVSEPPTGSVASALFTHLDGAPPEGECVVTKKVYAEDGSVVGWLSETHC